MSSSKTYLRIWNMVRKVPRGRITTYGTIAELCGLPGQARLVGYALHNLPHGSDVPWQRVINSRGMISFRKNQDAYEIQRSLLRKEGVIFVKEKASFGRYGWSGKIKKWR
jgi:methylated-DNA-protein-cysteine methyltransferase-like protein